MRHKLSSLPELDIILLETSFSYSPENSYARIKACIDDGGSVKLSQGSILQEEIRAGSSFYKGFKIEVASFYRDSTGVPKADLNIYNSEGQLEGRIYRARQFDSLVYNSKNGTEIIMHIFQPLAFGERPNILSNASKELYLYEGAEVCNLSVSMDWTTIQKRSRPDALKGISLSR